MNASHIPRLGALVAVLVMTACTETPEPVGLQFVAEGTSPQNTTYSGDATVVQARVLDLEPITVVTTGRLPEEGGELEASLLTVEVPGEATGGILALTATVAHASTIGGGSHSRSEASVAELDMIVAGNAIKAAFLQARARAACEGGGATATGSSELVSLMVNGQAIVVSGEPNQTVVDLPELKVVINEQDRTVSGNRADITVNALHVTAFAPVVGQVADVIISQAHADISCAAPPPPPPVCRDFVTGGGWITAPEGAKGNFGVAGGFKNGAFWGHLAYNDHGANGPKVKGTGVTGYERVNETTRRIEGTAEVNGQDGFTYEAIVEDKGEPGRSDRFELRLSGGYSAAGSLGGGNVQLHGNCP